MPLRPIEQGSMQEHHLVTCVLQGMSGKSWAESDGIPDEGILDTKDRTGFNEYYAKCSCRAGSTHHCAKITLSVHMKTHDLSYMGFLT